jgi:hypothetical protein
MANDIDYFGHKSTYPCSSWTAEGTSFPLLDEVLVLATVAGAGGGVEPPSRSLGTSEMAKNLCLVIFSRGNT